MTRYTQGGYYERKTLALLQADGYWCWQARGSKGAADVIALKQGQIVLVQVKSGRTPISGEGWNALYELAVLVGGLAIVAHWPTGRPADLIRITGPHREGARFWSYEPWTTDELVPHRVRPSARQRARYGP